MKAALMPIRSWKPGRDRPRWRGARSGRLLNWLVWNSLGSLDWLT